MISEQLKEDENYARACVSVCVCVCVCTKRGRRLICRRYSIRSNERMGLYQERNNNTLDEIDRTLLIAMQALLPSSYATLV